MLGINTIFHLKDIIKKSNKEINVNIDDTFFKIYYKVTTIFFLIYTFLILGNTLSIDPIKCVGDSHYSEDFVNTNCWTMSTFTYKSKTISSHENDLKTFQKNGKLDYFSEKFHNFLGEEKETITHSYYQWIPFLLVFNSILFYLPHFIWKNLENNLIYSLVSEIKEENKILHEKDIDKEKKTEKLIDYLYRKKKKFNWYGFKYIFCKLLNYIVIVISIVLTDIFFNNIFFDNDINLNNKIEILFPLQAKCDFFVTGSSGSLQNIDYLCILPINLLNRKIFLCIYLWYYIITLVSFLDILYFTIVLLIPFCTKFFWNFNSKEYSIGFTIVMYLISLNLKKKEFKYINKNIIKLE